MTPKPAVAGFVLAGGSSARMGVDKALLRVGDRTLVERACAILAEVAGSVYLLCSRDRPYSVAGVDCLFDQIEVGPLGGIHTALRQDLCETALLMPCDMPMIPPELYRTLLDLAGEHPVCVPLDRGEQMHPLIGCYRREVLSWIRQSLDKREFGVQAMLRRAGLSVRLVGSREHGCSDRVFSNVNTPRDLAKIRRLLDRPGS